MSGDYEGLDAWDLDPSAFPRDAPFTEQAIFALRWAVLAPSGHNTQPWLFRIRDDRVDVIADRTRALAVVDPHDRELIISCAAAAFTLELALQRFGIAIQAESFPDVANDDVVERLAVVDSAHAREDIALFDSITRRQTTRVRYEDRRLPDNLVAESDTRAAWVTTGRALQRVLLTATAGDVKCAFLNQPVEVAELRPRLAELMDCAAPQLVVRFGFGQSGPPEPRRPVQEVLLSTR